MDLSLPRDSSPGQDPAALWSLQLNLLRLAEDNLGPRDESKTIYQPTFVDDGPHIRNTPTLDGAFAELTRNAENYWPTTIYELAHETVHLLNPRPGVGNWLDEGVAVAFSVYAQIRYGLEPQRITMCSYRRSLRLVSDLPEGPLLTGRRIRETIGALWNANETVLRTMFPNIDGRTLSELCAPFERDWNHSATP